MKKQNGFTLIELVVVIVILGILAVTAAPKFLNLQDDAKVSAVKGLAGAMKGAAGITYGKAAVKGIESGVDETLVVDGQDVKLDYGYPKTASDLALVVDGLSTDWKEITPAPSGATVAYGYDDFDCVATYTASTSSAIPAKVNVVGKADNCEKN